MIANQQPITSAEIAKLWREHQQAIYDALEDMSNDPEDMPRVVFKATLEIVCGDGAVSDEEDL